MKSVISFRLITKISEKRKANGVTLTDSGSDISLKNLRDFDGLIWILPSEAAIHCHPSKEQF